MPYKPHFNFAYKPYILSKIHRIISSMSGELASSENLTVLGHQLEKNIYIYKAAVVLWLLGVLVFIFYHIMKHRHFLRMVKRWSEKITSIQVLDMVEQLRKELNITNQVELKLCSFLSSPMMIGFTKPIILLPALTITVDEWRYILKHEMIHFKYKDLWYKSLVLFVTALHWFNPLVYRIGREIAILCEMSCDAEVVKKNNFYERQEYSKAIISAVKKQSGMQTVFSTYFNRSTKGLKNRIFSIMDIDRKKTGIFILLTVLMATISMSTIFPLEVNVKNNNTREGVLIRSTEKSISTVIDSEGNMQQHIEEKQYEEFR